MDKGRREKHSFSVYLLYAVSVLGTLEQISSAKITGLHTGLFSLDIFVYIGLFIIAVLIHRGVILAKFAYALAALAWYAALLFYLPWKFNHALDIPAVSMQIIITIFAYCLFFNPKRTTSIEADETRTQSD